MGKIKQITVSEPFLIIFMIMNILTIVLMTLWVYHRTDYVRTGCAQFRKAGYYSINKNNPLYSVALDPDGNGVDC